MFEKQAEEIANTRCHEIMCWGHCSFSSPKHHRCGEWHREYNCAKEGIEYGYNKAREWHYVKDKLPIKTDSTLCELMPVFVAVKVGYKISTYGTYWNLKTGKFECLDEVYAWCYSPEPPELPKE